MLIKGSRYGDQLFGSDLADQIFGGGDNDTVYARGGDDIVYGNAGNDNMIGEDGNDDLRGGQGADRLWDYWGADFLQGGKGNDLLGGNAIDYTRDTMHGGPGNDDIWGGTGFDLMIGGEGDDRFTGMGGEYYGDGAPGIRQPVPIVGNDYMYSDLGNDYGTARIMTGGLGADIFDFRANPEGVATPVVITDFKNGQDDLRFYQVNYHLNYVHVLEEELDSNHDGRLDASDGWSAAGNVSVNYGNNSLTLTVGDGDSITLLNNTHLDYLI